jgi:hypothetical protein
MATPRPHKQLPLLPLARTSPRRPRARAAVSGCNSLRTPSFCRALPRHPAPYPPPRPGSVHSRRRAPRWVGEARDCRPRSRELPLPLCRVRLWATPRCRRFLGLSPGPWMPRLGARSASGTVTLGFSFLPSGLQVTLSHVSAAFPSLPTLRISSVPAGRSDSPMPPAAHIRRNGHTARRHTKAGRVNQQLPVSSSLPSPILPKLPEAGIPEASSEVLSQPAEEAVTDLPNSLSEVILSC